MNKRKLIIGGSVGAGVLLILVAFTTVVNAQATRTTIQDVISEIQKQKLTDEKMPLLQQIRELTIEGWQPGTFIVGFFGLIAFLLIVLISVMIGAYTGI